MPEQHAKLTDGQRRARHRLGRIYGIGLLVLVVAVLMCSDYVGLFGRMPKDDFQRYDGQTFWCAYVVDGDTLDVGFPDGRRGQTTTRVRLWGIDTPELAKDGKPAGHFADEAAGLTHQLTYSRQVTLQLVHSDTRDVHDRLLAYVILPDGRMLNRILLETGAAYADRRFEHPQMAEFLGLQAAAMEQRVGLWADVTEGDLPDYWQGRLDLPKPRP